MLQKWSMFLTRSQAYVVSETHWDCDGNWHAIVEHHNILHCVESEEQIAWEAEIATGWLNRFQILVPFRSDRYCGHFTFFLVAIIKDRMQFEIYMEVSYPTCSIFLLTHVLFATPFRRFERVARTYQYCMDRDWYFPLIQRQLEISWCKCMSCLLQHKFVSDSSEVPHRSEASDIAIFFVSSYVFCFVACWNSSRSHTREVEGEIIEKGDLDFHVDDLIF